MTYLPTILLTIALVIAVIAALYQRRRVKFWKQRYENTLWLRSGEFIYTKENNRHETYRRLLNTEL